MSSDQISGTSPETSVPTARRKFFGVILNKKNLLIIAGVAILILVAVLLWLKPWDKSTSTSPSSAQDQQTSQNQESVPATPVEPTIFYTQEVSSVEANDRIWPTVNIYRKVGSQQPELLAKNIGKVGEYPIKFTLSPDKNLMVINLEKNLKLLDVRTKKITDLFTSKYQSRSVVFSPDGNNILVWDQSTTANKYAVERLSLSDGESETLLAGTPNKNWPLGFSFKKWRNDNRVVMSLTSGSEFTAPYYFDISSKTIAKTPHTGSVDSFETSNSGDLIALPGDHIDDSCNEFSGTSTNKLDLLNPITGDKKFELKNKGKKIELVSFSPDSQEVLYVSFRVGHSPVKPRSIECKSYQSTPDYYRINLSNGEHSQVDDPQSVLKEWKSQTLLAKVETTNDLTEDKIIFKGEAIVSAEGQTLEIIAQYYQ